VRAVSRRAPRPRDPSLGPGRSQRRQLVDSQDQPPTGQTTHRHRNPRHQVRGRRRPTRPPTLARPTPRRHRLTRAKEPSRDENRACSGGSGHPSHKGSRSHACAHRFIQLRDGLWERGTRSLKSARCATGFGRGAPRPSPYNRPQLLEVDDRNDEDRDDVRDLDHRVDRRPGRVLVGIADRVAGHRGFVRR
jgi:hypothetical protein